MDTPLTGTLNVPVLVFDSPLAMALAWCPVQVLPTEGHGGARGVLPGADEVLLIHRPHGRTGKDCLQLPSPSFLSLLMPVSYTMCRGFPRRMVIKVGSSSNGMPPHHGITCCRPPHL